jgi:hypothetical protein
MVSIVGLLAVASIPTTIGVCEALSAQKKANAAAKEKAKFYITATLSLDGESFEECYCILKDGRVSLSPYTHPLQLKAGVAVRTLTSHTSAAVIE